MMLTQIKSWITGKVIFECECELTTESLRLGFAVKAAYKADADLRDADLRGADLRGADLRDAVLRGANLSCANLSCANLRGADLRGANLSCANLSCANLRDAVLRGADLRDAVLRGTKGIDDNFPLPEGITLGEFNRDIVPHLLTAGGKSIAEVVGSGCWDCHTWNNCPMHVALGISSDREAPSLLRPWVTRFVQLFDAKLIPCPVVPGAEGKQPTSVESATETN